MIDIQHLPEAPHPLCLEVMSVFKRRQQINEPYAQRLKAGLARIADRDELFHAAISIGYYALRLRRSGHVADAELLNRVLRGEAHRLESIRTTIAAQVDALREQRQKTCASQMGEEASPKRAPKIGEAPPEGALSLAELMPRQGVSWAPGLRIQRASSSGRPPT
jgi:hypothetical protein